MNLENIKKDQLVIFGRKSRQLSAAILSIIHVPWIFLMIGFCLYMLVGLAGPDSVKMYQFSLYVYL